MIKLVEYSSYSNEMKKKAKRKDPQRNICRAAHIGQENSLNISAFSSWREEIWAAQHLVGINELVFYLAKEPEEGRSQN